MRSSSVPATCVGPLLSTPVRMHLPITRYSLYPGTVPFQDSKNQDMKSPYCSSSVDMNKCLPLLPPSLSLPPPFCSPSSLPLSPFRCCAHVTCIQTSFNDDTPYIHNCTESLFLSLSFLPSPSLSIPLPPSLHLFLPTQPPVMVSGYNNFMRGQMANKPKEQHVTVRDGSIEVQFLYY